MMNPTIAEAFRRAITKGKGLSPEGMAVTEARVVRTFGNGDVEVLATGKDVDGRRYAMSAIVPVTGEGLRTLRAGEKVMVGWERRRPVVAFRHSAKRSGAPVPLPRRISPLVEDIFIAPRATDGVRDVFFRNFDAVTALRLDRFIAPSELGSVRWGPLNDRFFVQTFTRFHIFKLDRDPDSPLDGDPSNLVSLERNEDLSTNTTVLAVQLFDSGGSPASIAVTPANIAALARGSLVAACLDVEGALIASYLVSGAARPIPDSTPGANFKSSIGGFTGQPGVDGGFAYPVVIDATNGLVLLSVWEHNDFFSPRWSLLDFNTAPRTTVLFYEGSVVTGIARPTSWVQANTFTIGIDPPFEGHSTIDVTWWVGYSESPSSIQVRLEPILVLGKQVAPALRVRGWAAWKRTDHVVAVGQTFNVPTYSTFHAPTTSGEFIAFPASPFPVTPATAALARGPLAAAMVELYPLTRPAAGLSLARTLHRVLWRAPAQVAFTPAEQGLDVGGSDSPGFATLFEGGATVQVSPTLRASVGRRGLVAVATDFLYQLDNPAVALPAKADVNFFVEGWEFAGPTTLGTTSPTFPVELEDLVEAKALADTPKGVSHPISTGEFSLYVNNEQASLDPRGLFEELPTGQEVG